MTNNTKRMVGETQPQTDFLSCNNLLGMLRVIEGYIDKFGPDARLEISGSYWDDYGQRTLDHDELETHVVFEREETDAECAVRMAKEEKNRLAAEKRRMTQEQRLAKEKATEEANERALLEKLKKKYEVSPDESK